MTQNHSGPRGLLDGLLNRLPAGQLPVPQTINVPVSAPSVPPPSSPSGLGAGIGTPIPPLTGLRPVHIRLGIRSSDNGYIAELDDGESMLEDLPINLTPQDISERCAALRGVVQGIVGNRADNLYFKQDESEDALGRLAESGHAAFNQIFGDPNARQLLNQVIGGPGPISIEIVADTFVLPWELLYDRDLSQPLQMDGFWGFKYVIARLFRSRTAGALISTNGPPAVNLFTDNSLNSVAKDELPFFQSLQASGLVNLHPLRTLDNRKRRTEILQGLIPFMQQPGQIAHFACHAIPGATNVNDSALTLSDSFQLSLDDMRAYNMMLAGEPLVVLNACGTGIRDPLATSNFVREIILRGARGVIATECDVPDTFAAAFIQHLYTQHLLKGESVGDGLLATRLYFAQQYLNPIGLIYSLYARASLRLALQASPPTSPSAAPASSG